MLLHPTSLPGGHGIGDLGFAARRFVDFLAAGGQRWWQMLPVGPTGYGDSPYSAESAFAGNPMLIDLGALAADGLLVATDLDGVPPEGRIDHGAAWAFKAPRLRSAAEAFAARLAARPDDRARFVAFGEANRRWLDDFALYTAIKRAEGGAPWSSWSSGVALREPNAIASAQRALASDIAAIRFEQFVFAEQFAALRAYAAERGVGLIGDVPIFVAHDSADVWQHRDLFRLDARGRPEVVAGVPPDYFSRTGQRWGNPVYRWDVIAGDGYRFWIDRLRAALARFDVVRLDHFIGFTRAWEIPADEPTAEIGCWSPGPGERLFIAVRDALGGALPLIAEDLGAVTPEVIALRERLGLPGMRILQFAFGDDPAAPTFLPHAYERRTVAYTGTHDNDTARGWFDDRGGGAGTRTPEQTAREREVAMRYLASDGRAIHWDMIRAVSASVADTAIVPMQDLLGLGSEARMNRPGIAEGNWAWRFRAGDLTRALAERMARTARLYGRTPEDPRDLGAPASLGDFGEG
ncbi:4-alpha-glucanotransferase [Minicystis rosea]|nr:4-alpha-glucanotransferase [Minicystis rosea]